MAKRSATRGEFRSEDYTGAIKGNGDLTKLLALLPTNRFVTFVSSVGLPTSDSRRLIEAFKRNKA